MNDCCDCCDCCDCRDCRDCPEMILRATKQRRLKPPFSPIHRAMLCSTAIAIDGRAVKLSAIAHMCHRHYMVLFAAVFVLAFSHRLALAHAQTPTPQPPRLRTMVALVFGQSNAGNWGESRKVAGPRVLFFFRGRFGRARDPLPGANGDGGSAWTRLGDKLIAAKLYDRVIFVPASIGATEIAQWAPGGLLHKDLLRNVREAQAAGYKFTHLLWHQGESDAVLGTSKEEYEQRFLGMLGAIRDLGVDAPTFIALATRCGQYLPNEAIRAAQRELVNPALNIFQGPDTDQLDETYRYDGCHFSNAGLEAHAELWLRVIRDHIALTTPKPTDVLSTTRDH